MQRITIIQAKGGMVLADAAENEDGTVICGAGTPLTETLIGRLERFGVVRLTVEGHPVALKQEGKSEAELFADLDRRFARHAENPLMCELQAIFRDQLHARVTEMAAGDDPAVGDPAAE